MNAEKISEMYWKARETRSAVEASDRKRLSKLIRGKDREKKCWFCVEYSNIEPSGIVKGCGSCPLLKNGLCKASHLKGEPTTIAFWVVDEYLDNNVQKKDALKAADRLVDFMSELMYGRRKNGVNSKPTGSTEKSRS